MGSNKCLCGTVLDSITVRVEDTALSYNEVTDGWQCDTCMTLTLESNEAVAVVKVNKFRDYLSLEAYRLLFTCVRNTDHKTYYVYTDRLLGVDDLSKLSGINKSHIKPILHELWKKRLVMHVRGNDRDVFSVNAFLLGYVSKEEFLSRNFFGGDFFRINNKAKESATKRQLKKESLPNDFTDKERAETLAKFGGKCALTGKDVPLHFDHVIPIAIGHGGTTKANMIPIWQRINSSKSDRNIFEWYEQNGERFEVCPERFAGVIEYLSDLNGMTVPEYREHVYHCHENPNELGGI